MEVWEEMGISEEEYEEAMEGFAEWIEELFAVN